MCEYESVCHISISFSLPWVAGLTVLVLDVVLADWRYQKIFGKLLIIFMVVMFVCIGLSGFLFGKAYFVFGVYEGAAKGYIVAAALMMVYYQKTRGLYKKS